MKAPTRRVANNAIGSENHHTPGCGDWSEPSAEEQGERERIVLGRRLAIAGGGQVAQT